EAVRLQRQAQLHRGERKGDLDGAERRFQHPIAAARTATCALAATTEREPMCVWRCALAAFALLALGSAQAQVAVPRLEQRVTDLTSTLSAAQRDALEGKLNALEQRKGSQVAVLIVPTTQPEDIAEFGIRVADEWRLGRKGVDDGAILIVAKNDR